MVEWGVARPSVTRTSGQLVSDTMLTRLAYATTISGTTAITPTTQVFTGSGLYDPDVTGVGHQPRGLDQITPLYGQAITTGSRIYVELVTASTVPLYVWLIPNASILPGLPADPGAIAEIKYSKKFVWVPGSAARVMSHSMSVSKIFGVEAMEVLTNTLYRSDPSSANPTNYFSWNIFVLSFGATASIAYELNVRVEYDVRFINRKSPQVS